MSLIHVVYVIVVVHEDDVDGGHDNDDCDDDDDDGVVCVRQAEAWIRRKLQELQGGPAGQCCPLQGSEQASHTLHRDLKDFENTLTQLNQVTMAAAQLQTTVSLSSRDLTSKATRLKRSFGSHHTQLHSMAQGCFPPTQSSTKPVALSHWLPHGTVGSVYIRTSRIMNPSLTCRLPFGNKHAFRTKNANPTLAR